MANNLCLYSYKLLLRTFVTVAFTEDRQPSIMLIHESSLTPHFPLFAHRSSAIDSFSWLLKTPASYAGDVTWSYSSPDFSDGINKTLCTSSPSDPLSKLDISGNHRWNFSLDLWFNCIVSFMLSRLTMLPFLHLCLSRALFNSRLISLDILSVHRSTCMEELVGIFPMWSLSFIPHSC